MKASRLVSAPNWRYAVGEVVLIVVGVTIALAGNLRDFVLRDYEIATTAIYDILSEIAQELVAGN